MPEIDLSKVSVQISIPNHRYFPEKTVIALVDTAITLTRNQRPFSVLCQSGGDIYRDRSILVHEFLKSRHTHLFWIDSDMNWKAADFMKVLALSTMMPMVAATYLSKSDEHKKWLVRIRGKIQRNEWGCLPVNGVGLGFCCIQRKVIEQLAAKAPRYTFPDQPEPIAMVFRADNENGAYLGEDIAFFKDAGELGYKVWLDPAIDLGHFGQKEFKGSFLDFLEQFKSGETEHGGRERRWEEYATGDPCRVE